jgi:hypothetical protein
MDVAVIRVKPHFVNTPANVDNVAEGQPLRLEATFEPARDPTMKVQWWVPTRHFYRTSVHYRCKNNQPIVASQLVQTEWELGHASLHIVNAYANHSGLYTVNIANSEGTAAASATVKVGIC